MSAIFGNARKTKVTFAQENIKLDFLLICINEDLNLVLVQFCYCANPKTVNTLI